VLSMSGFLGSVLNTIPVVGHIKGVVHYVTGDTEAGNDAMHSATRTSAVIGGAVGGTLAGGPVGGVAAAIGAGNAVDVGFTVGESIANDEWSPRGNIEAATNIVTKGDVLGGLTEIAVNTGVDALGGYGAGSFLGKSAAKGVMAEGGKAAIKQGSKAALKQLAKESAAMAFFALTADNAGKKKRTRYGRIRNPKSCIGWKGGQDGDNNGSNKGNQQNNGSNRHGQNNGSDEDDTEEEESSSSFEETSSSEDESSEDDTRCQAILSDGSQCKKEATGGGSCNLKSHQRQLRNNRRLYSLRLQLQRLEDIRNNPGNNTSVRERILTALNTSQYENRGFIYIYTLANGDIKIGRTVQTDPRVRWNQQRQYPQKQGIKTWMCRCHVLAETLIMNYLDFARKQNARENNVEEFDGDIVSRSQAEIIIREIIKEIHRRMKEIDRHVEENDEEEESSELNSTHW